MSALLKASVVVMELCFLVNNDSFHFSTAFSPAADIDGAEGKEKEREGVCCCSRLISNMKSTLCVSQALLLLCSFITYMIQNYFVCVANKNDEKCNKISCWIKISEEKNNIAGAYG